MKRIKIVYVGTLTDLANMFESEMEDDDLDNKDIRTY
jgi:hypothetical protein